MKRITLLLTALLMLTSSMVAQIKLVVYKCDGTEIELLASDVDSIGFKGIPADTDDEDDDNDGPIIVDPDDEDWEIPEVEKPGRGKTTIVLYIPESDCDYAEPYILGVLEGIGKWSNEPDRAMESLGGGWWQVTVEALTPENATNFKFRMEDGAGSWSFEPKGSYELLEDASEFLQVKADETNNLLAIANCDNKVLYIKSGRWSLTPCMIVDISNKDISEPSGYHRGYGYVDLGLPSGTLWATMNVGADSPEDYGDYFAWGETESKDYYGWDTYKWMTDGMSSWMGVNKYTYPDGETSAVWYDENGEFIGDNKTVLELADDAANANWEGDWVMPTNEEQLELSQYCTSVITRLDGVVGRMFTGPNGNSIFLPAAGYRDYSGLYGAGPNGRYWSSSLSTYDSDGAYVLYLGSDIPYWSCSDRYYGLSVRPVLRVELP